MQILKAQKDRKVVSLFAHSRYKCIIAVSRMLMKLDSGVNFIIVSEQLLRADPETVFFVLLESGCFKAARKMAVKLTPAGF